MAPGPVSGKSSNPGPLSWTEKVFFPGPYRQGNSWELEYLAVLFLEDPKCPLGLGQAGKYTGTLGEVCSLSETLDNLSHKVARLLHVN